MEHVITALGATDKPMSTIDVAVNVCQMGPQGERDVWLTLDRLARRGTVERIRDPNLSSRLWRLVDADTADA